MQCQSGQSYSCRILTLLSIAALTFPQLTFSAVCSSLSEQNSLFLGETVDLQEKGKVQAAASASFESADRREFELAIDYGIDRRAQVMVAGRQERQEGTSSDRIVDAALGVGLLCSPEGTVVRFDLGVLHNRGADETQRYARLTAGGPFMFGSWHAGATHGTSAELRSYFGAAILQTDLTPFALEAKRETDGAIWKTLVSAGLYLYSSDTVELALGLAQPEDRGDQRRRLMLKLTGEF